MSERSWPMPEDRLEFPETYEPAVAPGLAWSGSAKELDDDVTHAAGALDAGVEGAPSPEV
jgi:hypothetical protein